MWQKIATTSDNINNQYKINYMTITNHLLRIAALGLFALSSTAATDTTASTQAAAPAATNTAAPTQATAPAATDTTASTQATAPAATNTAAPTQATAPAATAIDTTADDDLSATTAD